MPPTTSPIDLEAPIALDGLVALDAHLGQTDARLAHLEDEVLLQGKQAKRAQQAFSIFALLALLIAAGNLLVVAAKLDKPTATAAAPAALPHQVGATLREFSVGATSAKAAAGRVTFHVRNSGSITHEFVVLRTNAPASSLPMKNGRADEAGNVGETGDLKPGAAKTIALNLKPGHYALICNLPGHYRAGQHADLTVR